MCAVSFDIRDIVNDLYDAGNQTEKDCPQDRAQHCIDIRQFAIKDQWGKDEDVFGPLFWTHGFEYRS